MRILFLALFLSVGAIARADFSDDQYTEHPDVLARIVTATQNHKSFQSFVDGDTALYLRRAEYIGPLDGPFGTVHVAKLFYIRSARHGSKLPARGHTYIVFLDENFKIRSSWSVNMPDEPVISVEGAKLMTDKTVVFDLAHPPHNGTVLFDGDVKGVPNW